MSSAMRALLLTTLAYSSQASAEVPRSYDWEREDPQHGLEVYTSDAPDHGYDAIKVVTTLAVPLRVLLARLQDFDRYPSWYHDCSSVRVLTRPPASSQLTVTDGGRVERMSGSLAYVLLFVQRVPPLDDRWAILQSSLRVVGSTVVLDFHSLAKHPYRGPSGSTRMRLRGTWKLTPLSPQRTQVSFVLDVDPRVDVPAFMVDPRLLEIAVETVRGLRRITQR